MKIDKNRPLELKSTLRLSLEAALQEVKDWKKGKTQLRTLEEFLVDKN